MHNAKEALADAQADLDQTDIALQQAQENLDAEEDDDAEED